MRHTGDNTWKSQDNHEGFRALPLNRVECEFFSTHTWQREWTPLTFVRPPREKKLPVILSPTEVRTILAGVQLPRDRICLSTIYACGLRLPEGTPLQVSDIDAARMCLHVRLGKGAKDRYVPLPRRILER
jgi:integrase/recombinase XerD